MQKEIEKLSEHEILKSYPIKDDSLGWYFRTEEISNGAWQVEGSDLWGRKEEERGQISPCIMSRTIKTNVQPI